jgi:hypothetical protein
MAELSALSALVALVISIYALTFHRRLGHETSTQTLIHAQYELCRALDTLRVQHPEISHMLALPSKGTEPWRNYRDFKRQVRHLAAKPITEKMKARLYLQEHATALHVFDIYEQTLHQRRLAKTARDTNRFNVLDELVKYYETRMLRSPRLRFHWEKGGSDMMDPATIKRYDARVRRKYPHELPDDKSPLEEPSAGYEFQASCV